MTSIKPARLAPSNTIRRAGHQRMAGGERKVRQNGELRLEFAEVDDRLVTLQNGRLDTPDSVPLISSIQDQKEPALRLQGVGFPITSGAIGPRRRTA